MKHELLFYRICIFLLVICFVLNESGVLHSKDALGLYNQVSDKITIFPERIGGDLFVLEYVAYHEYGHYIFDEVLSVGKKREWIDCWKNTEDRITNYADTNYKEGFAEAFATYQFPEYYRQKDDVKCMERLYYG